jgi:hypothetical protein
MSVSFSATPGGYYAVTQPFGVPAQRQRPAAPEPSDAQNGTSFTMPPGVPLHGNPKDLVADLCKIIERQSQEIAALRAERAEKAPFSPPLASKLHPEGSGQTTPSVLASPKPEDSAETVPLDEDSSETAHSSTDDEPDDGKVPSFSCGLEVNCIAHRRRPSAPSPAARPWPLVCALPTSADPSPPAHKPSGAAAQALTAAAVDSMSGDEGGDAMGAIRKKPRLGPEMDETGNRQCAACGTTQTPKWRCGMTLCNACGLRNAKRRCSSSGPARPKAAPPPQHQHQPQQHSQPAPSYTHSHPQVAMPVQAIPHPQLAAMPQPAQQLHQPALPQPYANHPGMPSAHFYYTHAYPGLASRGYASAPQLQPFSQHPSMPAGHMAPAPAVALSAQAMPMPSMVAEPIGAAPPHLTLAAA